jgi:ABC-type dipeptide/oligopeptide/nickel transport system ATPase component
VPKGSVSETVRPHDGCRFHPRCVRAGPRCWKERPSMRNGVRCHLWGNRS